MIPERAMLLLAKYFLDELQNGNLDKVVHFLKVFVEITEKKNEQEAS